MHLNSNRRPPALTANDLEADTQQLLQRLETEGISIQEQQRQRYQVMLNQLERTAEHYQGVVPDDHDLWKSIQQRRNELQSLLGNIPSPTDNLEPPVSVDWGNHNQPVEAEPNEALYQRAISFAVFAMVLIIFCGAIGLLRLAETGRYSPLPLLWNNHTTAPRPAPMPTQDAPVR